MVPLWNQYSSLQSIVSGARPNTHLCCRPDIICGGCGNWTVLFVSLSTNRGHQSALMLNFSNEGESNYLWLRSQSNWESFCPNNPLFQTHFRNVQGTLACNTSFFFFRKRGNWSWLRCLSLLWRLRREKGGHKFPEQSPSDAVCRMTPS